MSVMERRRLAVFSQVQERAISVAEAGRLLRLSERQAQRLWHRYREQGDGGLVHGLRGRPGNAAHGELQAQVLAAYRARYGGFSAAHATEFLAREDLAVPRTTCWRWLKAAGLIADVRKVKAHRQRRERRRAVGELVQMDGSTHRWFGPALPPAVLFVMIDDVLNDVRFRFAGQGECDVLPRLTPNLYMDKPLVLYARYPRDVQRLVFQATGQAGDIQCDMVFDLDLAKSLAGEKEIRTQWAWQKVYDLIGEHNRTHDPALVDVIRSLGKTYGIRIPYRAQLKD